MSEYQYYEFLSIDRPLTSDEMAALRAYSTRAHITPVSFTNEYHWGNFGGDPRDLMRRYFDAHIYVANWMTAIFMLRLPIEAISEKTAKAIEEKGIIDFEATETHWIITWSLYESENYDRFGMENGHGMMAQLAPVREELLRGDLRSLYIGWLAAVTMGMTDDDEMEPLAMEGLGCLTPAQQTLAKFMEVDQDLLTGVGTGSPAPQDEISSQEEMDDWIVGLPQDEGAEFLKLLLAGRGQQAQKTIRERFAVWRCGLRNDRGEVPRRTVGELRKNAETAEKLRFELEKREQERREVKRREERQKYLETLANDLPNMWEAVQQTVERGTGQAYDEACRILVDFSEAYSVHVNRKNFQQELRKFMEGHMRRKALIQRLVKAGIWHGK